MKTELRPSAHLILNAQVVELWHDGQFIGLVTGADGPGVRIISKYIRNIDGGILIALEEPPVVEVRLEP